MSQYLGHPQVMGSKLKSPLIQMSDLSNSISTTDEHRSNSYTRELNSIGKQYKTIIDPKKQKQATDRINAIITECKPYLQQLDENVKSLQKDTEDLTALQAKSLTKEARSCIQKYKQAQEKLSKKVKDDISRQAMNIKSDLTEEQLADISRNPQLCQELLQTAILDGPSVQLQNKVSDLVDKARDLMKLEKSMQECMEMMAEMALLVEYQDQQIVHIGECVTFANQKVNTGTKKLGQAKQLHKKADKKICCLIFLMLAVVGVVVIPVVITQT